MLSSVVMAASRSDCSDGGSECVANSLAPEMGHALLQKGRISKRATLGTGARVQHDSTEEVFQPSNSIGTTAPLNEAGYQLVAATCCHLEIRRFTARLVADLGLVVCDQGGLSGLVIWFDCGNTSSFDALQRNIIASQPPNACAFVAQAGMCPAAKDPTCGGEFNPDAFPECPLITTTAPIGTSGGATAGAAPGATLGAPTAGPVTTSTIEPIAAGATSVPVADLTGIQAGMLIIVGNISANNSETRSIVSTSEAAFLQSAQVSNSRALSNLQSGQAGSITVNSAFLKSWPAGTPVITMEEVYFAHRTPTDEYCADSQGWSSGAASSGLQECQIRCGQESSCNYISFWTTGGQNYCHLTETCDVVDNQPGHVIVTYEKQAGDSPTTTLTTQVSAATDMPALATTLAPEPFSMPAPTPLPTPAPTPAASQAPNASFRVYVGCFTDSFDHDLPISKGIQSFEGCAQQCEGSKYFGRQGAKECFCGDSYGKHPKSKHCHCDKDAAYMGWFQQCIYEYKDSTTTTTTTRAPIVKGCFAENPWDRDLPEEKGEQTFEGCLEACKGYKYFGRHAESQCFCGDSYGKHGESDLCPDCTDTSLTFLGWWCQCIYEYP